MTYAVLIHDQDGVRRNSAWELTREQAIARFEKEKSAGMRAYIHEYDWSGFPQPSFGKAQNDSKPRKDREARNIPVPKGANAATGTHGPSNEEISTKPNQRKSNESAVQSVSKPKAKGKSRGNEPTLFE